ncbi:MAG TPA: PBP1A family penicillin-binding protein [Candidatus Kapabacteria bacterium]|jgi:penicillin-binding protein 1A|nr:PBP1A family penicillin-binding protein [Candidatus Kapabacteria bacterium]
MAKHWWLENDGDEEEAESEEADGADGVFQKTRSKRKKHSWKTWQLVLVSAIAIFAGIFTWLWIEIGKGLPTLDQLENPHPELATRLISADGEPLDQYYIKNRTTVELKDVPPDLIAALISTEDRDFYKHWGINLWGNIRAAWTDLVTLSPRQGASTITQQLARNLYLTQEKSMMRKLREMASAVQIERTHTKNEILEMYLNVAYFGRGAYGIEAASQVYFGKDVGQLSTAESAYLVGILKGPENYDPDDNYDRAIARRNTVLQNLVETKYLSREQAEEVEVQPIRVQPIKGYQGIAPHFVEMIRQELTRTPELQGYDLYRDGLVVYTTLNATMQRAANKAVEEHISQYQKTVVDKRWNWSAHTGLLDSLITKAVHTNPEYHFAQTLQDKKRIDQQLRSNKAYIDSIKQASIRMQCGFVCLDQSTGQVLAMVGSSNFQQTRYGLNHVTQIVRQPGSAFKPIIYAACFEAGATPETSVSDEAVSIPDGDHIWSPGNFEGEAVGGFRTIRTALQYSVNLCAVHAALEITNLHDVIRMAKRLGIRSNIPAYPSIALGTAEVNPLELTSAYSTFANEGVRATPYAIVRVEDRNGKIIYRTHPEFDNVLEPRICHMMTSALMDVVNSGTAARIRSLGFHFPAAGKTGTTQNFADAWFIGYTPQFTAGVWVGFDDKRITFTGADGQGGRAAAPIWGIFMKYVYEELRPPIQYFTTSYSNLGTPGELRPQEDKGDSNGTPIEINPNAPNNSNPTIQQPQPAPPSTVGDNVDENNSNPIGGWQPHPPPSAIISSTNSDEPYGPTITSKKSGPSGVPSKMTNNSDIGPQLPPYVAAPKKPQPGDNTNDQNAQSGKEQ